MRFEIFKDMNLITIGSSKDDLKLYLQVIRPKQNRLNKVSLFFLMALFMSYTDLKIRLLDLTLLYFQENTQRYIISELLVKNICCYCHKRL